MNYPPCRVVVEICLNSRYSPVSKAGHAIVAETVLKAIETAGAETGEPMADLILSGGDILTVNNRASTKAALIVKDGRSVNRRSESP